MQVRFCPDLSIITETGTQIPGSSFDGMCEREKMCLIFLILIQASVQLVFK